MDFFVYGTLTDPATADALLDSYAFLGGARVDGLHVAAGTTPTLLPGGEAAGRLLRTDEVAALDRYERVDEGLYVRVELPWADGGSVETYVGDPAALGVDGVGSKTRRGDGTAGAVDGEGRDTPGSRTNSDDGWPGEGPLAERVRSYVDRAGVVVRRMD